MHFLILICPDLFTKFSDLTGPNTASISYELYTTYQADSSQRNPPKVESPLPYYKCHAPVGLPSLPKVESLLPHYKCHTPLGLPQSSKSRVSSILLQMSRV